MPTGTLKSSANHRPVHRRRVEHAGQSMPTRQRRIDRTWIPMRPGRTANGISRISTDCMTPAPASGANGLPSKTVLNWFAPLSTDFLESHCSDLPAVHSRPERELARTARRDSTVFVDEHDGERRGASVRSGTLASAAVISAEVFSISSAAQSSDNRQRSAGGASGVTKSHFTSAPGCLVNLPLGTIPEPATFSSEWPAAVSGPQFTARRRYFPAPTAADVSAPFQGIRTDSPPQRNLRAAACVRPHRGGRAPHTEPRGQSTRRQVRALPGLNAPALQGRPEACTTPGFLVTDSHFHSRFTPCSIS